MDNAGVVGGNEVFKDRETGSRWQQSSLEAISGPLKGERLELYPFLLTSWEEWRRLHPDTLVLKPLPGYAERIPAKNAQLRVGFPLSKPAPDDVVHRDDRLKAYAKVVGLTVADASRAFPSIRSIAFASSTRNSAASRSWSCTSRSRRRRRRSSRARTGCA